MLVNAAIEMLNSNGFTVDKIDMSVVPLPNEQESDSLLSGEPFGSTRNGIYRYHIYYLGSDLALEVKREGQILRMRELTLEDTISKLIKLCQARETCTDESMTEIEAINILTKYTDITDNKWPNPPFLAGRLKSEEYALEKNYRAGSFVITCIGQFNFLHARSQNHSLAFPRYVETLQEAIGIIVDFCSLYSR